MAKAGKHGPVERLQSAARLTRTALASRLIDHGFYPGQDQIMLALDLQDGQTPGQLAVRLGVKPPTVTKTVSRLQAQGFVSKQSSDSDGRQAHIFLTSPGRDAIRAIQKCRRKTEKQALRGLDKKELKQFMKLLQKVESNFSGLSITDEDEADTEAELVLAEA